MRALGKAGFHGLVPTSWKCVQRAAHAIGGKKDVPARVLSASCVTLRLFTTTI